MVGNVTGQVESGANHHNISIAIVVIEALVAIMAFIPHGKVDLHAVVAIMALVLTGVTGVHLAGHLPEKPFKIGLIAGLFFIAVASIVNIFMERGKTIEIPFIQIEGFVDRIQPDTGHPNGKRDGQENPIRMHDGWDITFVPERSREEVVKFNSPYSFSKFEPGEKISISLCGITQDVQTFPLGHAQAANAYPVKFAIPEDIVGRCMEAK